MKVINKLTEPTIANKLRWFARDNNWYFAYNAFARKTWYGHARTAFARLSACWWEDDTPISVWSYGGGEKANRIAEFLEQECPNTEITLVIASENEKWIYWGNVGYMD